MSDQVNDGKTRLLAVDDSVDSAELVARMATRCGFEARAISESDSVRNAIVDWKPDILTLDLCMPGADGIDLLSVLKEIEFTGKVIIISGQDSWFRKIAIELAGTRGVQVVGDMQKPVDIRALRKLLTDLAPPASKVTEAALG
jgi:two-component system, chemotaxis family, chemotaxis protein CheY